MIGLVAFPNMNEILWLVQRQCIEDYRLHYAEMQVAGAMPRANVGTASAVKPKLLRAVRKA